MNCLEIERQLDAYLSAVSSRRLNQRRCRACRGVRGAAADGWPVVNRWASSSGRRRIIQRRIDCRGAVQAHPESAKADADDACRGPRPYCSRPRSAA